MASLRQVLRYLWDHDELPRDLEHALVVLGETYNPVDLPGKEFDALARPGEPAQAQPSQAPPQWPPAFLADVRSRIWLTYRTNFPLIPRAPDGPSTITFSGLLRGSGIDLTGFTSDVGWGCMIRTAQSLLANTLVRLRLGRGWRFEVSPESDASIVQLFCDSPEAPFSLHNFVAHGENFCGKSPGQWFGPSAAASSIKALCGDLLAVYISDGSDIYEDQLRQVAGQHFQRPVLILLGLRLGIDSINMVYWPAVQDFLACPQAVGIAGGRPSASHYFYGYQNHSLLYLDPHVPKPHMKLDSSGTLGADMLSSVHTDRVRLLHMREMDPSMLVGVLIRNEDDWNDWRARVMSAEFRSAISISATAPDLNTSVGDNDEEGFVDVMVEDSFGEDNDTFDQIDDTFGRVDDAYDEVKVDESDSFDVQSDDDEVGEGVKVEAENDTFDVQSDDDEVGDGVRVEVPAEVPLEKTASIDEWQVMRQ